MSNIIEVVGKFVSFLSKPIGTALNKGIETAIGKTVEYKMDQYLTSTSQEKKTSNGEPQLFLQNNRILNNQYCFSNLVKPSLNEMDHMRFIIQNNSFYSNIGNLISDKLEIAPKKEVFSIYDTRFWDQCSNPTILICLRGETALRCDLTTKNIIPGVNDIATLSLNYKTPQLPKNSYFNEEISDSIVTAASLLKNTGSFCCNMIHTHIERLQLEAELLYNKGYRNISFKEIPENGGYICELFVARKDFVFFLPYEYPLMAPEVWVYEGRNSYSIPFANDCWKKEYTISQLISVIERGYYGYNN